MENYTDNCFAEYYTKTELREIILDTLKTMIAGLERGEYRDCWCAAGVLPSMIQGIGCKD